MSSSHLNKIVTRYLFFIDHYSDHFERYRDRPHENPESAIDFHDTEVSRRLDMRDLLEYYTHIGIPNELLPKPESAVGEMSRKRKRAYREDLRPKIEAYIDSRRTSDLAAYYEQHWDSSDLDPVAEVLCLDLAHVVWRYADNDRITVTNNMKRWSLTLPELRRLLQAIPPDRDLRDGMTAFELMVHEYLDCRVLCSNRSNFPGYDEAFLHMAVIYCLKPLKQNQRATSHWFSKMLFAPWDAFEADRFVDSVLPDYDEVFSQMQEYISERCESTTGLFDTEWLKTEVPWSQIEAYKQHKQTAPGCVTARLEYLVNLGIDRESTLFQA